MFYVYVLQDPITHKLYIGYSADLKRRMCEHAAKIVRSTKSGEYKLIYYEAYPNKHDALGREKFLKSGSGRKYLNKQLKNHFEKSALEVNI